MTDQELVAAAKPPTPLADALLRQSESDVAALLELLFCCHQLLDEPEQTESKWYDCDTAWVVKRQYLESKVQPAWQAIAPSWEDAMRITLEWLEAWPHNCGEFDKWAYRRGEMEDATAISYFRGMLAERVTAKP